MPPARPPASSRQRASSRSLRRLFPRCLEWGLGALLLLVVAFAGLIAWPAPNVPDRSQSGRFLVRNVAIVDVEEGRVRHEWDVVLESGSVASIEPHDPARTPEGVTVVEGAGRFLMPGLWDMHTHSTGFAPQYQHPLFIAFGVTAVRDLWGCMSRPDPFIACAEEREAWNQALARGEGVHPRYIGQSSFQINGGNEVPGSFEPFFRASTAEEARSLARFYSKAGVDFLKVYSELSPEAYSRLADAALDEGLFLVGHRPFRVSLQETVAAGQRSIEHGRLFALECFADAAEFRRSEDPVAEYTPALRRRLVDEQDEARCARLMSLMAASETWWTPTLLTLRMGAYAADAEFREDERLRYVPWLLKRLMWFPDADGTARTATDENGRNIRRELYRLAQAQVGAAHEAGVGILVGTDAFDTYVFPGASIHDEMQALVASGPSPAEVLRAATYDAAAFSGVSERYGSVTVGHAADLLLLDGNPLEDIRHTKAIRAVFLDGRHFDRDALDALLDFAASRASSLSQNLKILWMGARSPLLRLQFAD